MANARANLEWEQTSFQLVMLRNVNTGKGKTISNPNYFNPYAAKELKKSPIKKADISILKTVFVDGKLPTN